MRKLFVDSDVVLSSLLSSKGAANFLLNELDIKLAISNISLPEIARGIDKLNKQKIKEDFGIVVLTPSQYLQYLRSLG